MILNQWLASRAKVEADQESQPPVNEASEISLQTVSIPPEALAALLPFRDDSGSPNFALNQLGVDSDRREVAATNARIALLLKISLPGRSGQFVTVDTHEGVYPKLHSCVFGVDDTDCGFRKFRLDVELLKTLVSSLGLIATRDGETGRQYCTVLIPEHSNAPIHFRAVTNFGSAKAAIIPVDIDQEGDVE